MLILPIKSKWKNGEQNPEQNTTRYTYTKSEKGKIVKCSRQYLRHIALMS